MIKNLFMGIDLGTSSVKVILMQGDGTVLTSVSKEYDILKPKPHYAEQDMEQLWAATKVAISSCINSHKEFADYIGGISFSGQMHGLVALDQENNPLLPAIIWADQRSAGSIQSIYKQVPREEFQRVTYNSLSTGFLISSLVWIKQNEPKKYEQIKTVLLPKDYIRYRICGELGTDCSDASSSVIFDVKNRTFAWEFIKKLSLNPEMFPICKESYEQAGTVTKQCSTETGLPEGIPVMYGGGDSLMQAVGNGMIKPGVLASNIGTACQMVCSLDTPIADPLYRTNTFCSVSEQLWNIQGSMLSGGVALKWLKNQVLHERSYDAMTLKAKQIPAGSEGLLFLPYLSGERTPYNNPGATALFHGLTLRHTDAHMIRSVMEGIVFALRDSLEIFDSIGISYNKIVASGGGARSDLFLQLQADLFHQPIYVTTGNEQACVGAAITAGVGTGYYSSYAEGCQTAVHFKSTITEPLKENISLYDELFSKYKELYPHNKDIMGDAYGA